MAASEGCDFSVGGSVKAAFIASSGNSPLTAPSFGLTTTIAWSPTLRVALPRGCRHVASAAQRTSPKFWEEAALRASTILCSHCFTKALSSVASAWACSASAVATSCLSVASGPLMGFSGETLLVAGGGAGEVIFWRGCWRRRGRR